MENQRDPEGTTSPGKESPSSQDGESRRAFIKKLPYIAPVVQTFLLSETAFGSDRRGGEGEDDQGGDDNDQGDDHGDNQGDDNDNHEDDNDHGGRRRRRQVSPQTRGRGRGRG
ncbi:MAG: hypothetical protein IT369_09090 [Candidatus Latescibacteria bacterium]|nr:hypothetical protein [Candidatus Latescibacterota bacterium]